MMKKFNLILILCVVFAAVMCAPVSVEAADMSGPEVSLSDEEIMKIVHENLRILNLAATGWCDRYPDSDKMDDGVKVYYVHIGVSTIDDTHGSRIFHGDVWVDSATKAVRIEMVEVNESTQ